MKRRQLVLPLAGSAALSVLAPLARASTFPAKPIKVLVPYAAGGVVDVQARAVIQTMAEILKVSIVVEPRPGASGSIAAEAVAQAAPDGYTLMVSASFINSAPMIETNLRWSTRRVTPGGRVSLSPRY